jgi:hypothetical protein
MFKTPLKQELNHSEKRDSGLKYAVINKYND